MAQDFERNIARNVGTAAVTMRTANSDDALIGINIANVTTSQINMDVFINDGSNDYYIVKDAPIPAGSALQVLDGGAKVVMQASDVLKVQSDTASSADVWVSVVDTISS
mgnify:FL=1|jgi:hypothetical protein|tara:strand:- start:301 stop:627 length:327 start_codon:yes stop_codon:yes gene_type:complete